MPIRVPPVPTLILSALILTVACPGCARRNILFESKKDVMPCTEYGGKISMAMRAEPVLPDRGLASHHAAVPMAPVWSEPVPTPRPLPSVNEPSVDPGPLFFAPPSLGPPQEWPVTQTGFDSHGSTDNTVFAASYPSPLPLDSAYSGAPVGDPGAAAFAPPRLSVDSLDVEDPMAPIGSRQRVRRPRLRAMWLEAKHNVCSDHSNYYDRGTMAKLAYGLVLGSVLANTSMDQDFQDWYQQDVRSDDTDDFSTFFKTFGEGHLFIPTFACMAFAGKFVADWPVVGPVGEFSARTTRGYLVGAPPMLFMQFMLGASRPGETDHSSHWYPFEDTNSVSGHAFMGAVPFITAARMTDGFFLKSGLYACSTLTAYSRINDDRHYLSQAILGWWMAYLACEAVDHTHLKGHGMTFMPIASADTVGFAGIYEY